MSLKLLNLILKLKKYNFPKETPGAVVNSENTEWIKDATFTFLTSSLYHNYDDLPNDTKTRIKNIYTKEDYTFIIENYLRKINKLYYK